MKNRWQFSQESNPGVYQRSPAAAQSRGPSLTDLFAEYNRLNLMVMDRVNQMVMDSLQPAITSLQSRQSPAPHLKKECADPCQHDSCHCSCCIGDADLVVYARLGETRVVPIVIENSRHRERSITFELSDWTTHGGKKTAIKSALSEKGFVLPACSEKAVILTINASQFDPAGTNAQNRQNDVDDCQTVYADLRIEGCDTRPLRLALAFLPRDCAPFEIDCGCNCCQD